MILTLLLACAPAPTASPEAACTTAAGEADEPPVTTRTRRLVLDPALPEPTAYNPALPDGLAEALDAGLGTWHEEDGEDWLRRDELAPGAAPAADRTSLALFLHQSDAQLADAESPTRLAAWDAPGTTQSALRPQELYGAAALDALIRAVNALTASAPIDFALATGDNADSAQRNELAWFAAIWDGLPLRPDSGAPDAQPDADCHDPLAAFTPAGADFPWYAVSGNHDVLVQGNFEPRSWVDDALGSDAPGGTRDLSQPGGPLTYATSEDPERALLERSDIAALLLDSPALPGPVGHGLTEANVRDDSVGWVARPRPAVPLRLISVDANPSGPTDGVLSADERDRWLIPQLQAGEAAGDLMIITSHYALSDLAVEGGGRVGDLLAGFPHVVLVVAGHWHANVIRPYGPPDDPAAFWEIVSASTADWPPQGRLIELVDNRDGTLSVFTTLVDVPAPAGSMEARFRQLAAIDLQTGWRSSDGTGGREDRNVELIQRLPAGWSSDASLGGVRSTALP